MAKLQTDLKEFIALLNSLEVEYLVVGGHAVAFHGHPRFTGDIDLLLRATRANADRVMAVLREFGFGELQLAAEDFLVPQQIVQLGRPPNRIDLLTSISGVGFDDAWSTRVPGELDGQPVYFLGLDALIRNKKSSDRDVDRSDVSTLLAIASRKKAD